MQRFPSSCIRLWPGLTYNTALRNGGNFSENVNCLEKEQQFATYVTGGQRQKTYEEANGLRTVFIGTQKVSERPKEDVQDNERSDRNSCCPQIVK